MIGTSIVTGHTGALQGITGHGFTTELKDEGTRSFTYTLDIYLTNTNNSFWRHEDYCVPLHAVLVLALLVVIARAVHPRV